MTLFILIGILLLAAFGFVLFLSGKIKTQELEQGQEAIITKALEKEAVRLYVRDCLEDSLTQGLLLQGKQGGITKEEGGVRKFIPDVTGADVTGEKKFYAVARQQYPDPENRYPCKQSDFFPTSPFCRYVYPSTRLFFGRNPLSLGILEEELEKYLVGETTKCLQNKLLQTVGQGTVKAEGAQLDFTLTDSGANVKVHYPLTLEAGGREFFQLSEFDFFYPTELKQVLDVAVLQPLGWDWQYVDFSYDASTLQQDSFSYASEQDVPGEQCVAEGTHFRCRKATFADKYEALGIELSKTELDSGDDLFAVKPAWDDQKLKDYQFVFARQNRPPALDYISRCPDQNGEFDFLVVEGDTQLGVVSINATAHDPDEDSVEYSYASGGVAVVRDSQGVILLPSIRDDALLVSASDGHIADWQNVKFKKVPKLEPQMTLYSQVLYPQEPPTTPPENVVLSLEDPICLQLNTPEQIRALPFPLSLNGRDISGIREGNNGLFGVDGKSVVNCAWNGYDITTIRNFLDEFLNIGANALRVTGDVPYGDDERCTGKVDNIIALSVRPCVPYGEPGKSDPYIPGQTPILENPFLLNHSCCEGNMDDPATWKLAAAESVCFQREGCFTAASPHLYKRIRRCADPTEAVRGNMCQGNLEVVPVLRNNNNICGAEDKEQCQGSLKSSAPQCEEQEAWGFFAGEGWCYGNGGCSSYCNSEIVDTTATGGAGSGITPSAQPYGGAIKEQFACGCKGKEGYGCDDDFDGIFDGTCRAGRCKEA